MSASGHDRFDDDSDEEFPNGELGSGRWSVSGASSSSSSSALAETRATPATVVSLERSANTRESSVSLESSPASTRSQIEPSLVDYLLKHRDDISLESIKATHELLSELKQSQPNKSLNEHLSDLRKKYYAPETVKSESDTSKELTSAKQTIDRLELKLKLLDQRLKDELSCSNERLKVNDIFRNSGAIDYMESQRKSLKAKSDMIADLKAETDRLKKEKFELREQCKRASDLNEHYCRLLREAESGQTRHAGFPSSRDLSLNQERMLNDSSPAPSLDESRVPPPPPIEVPSIDEMLRMARSPPSLNQSRQQHHDSRLYASADNSQYNGMDMSDNSIPPPPLENADLDEIFREISFGSQQGQRQTQHSQSMNSMYNIPSKYSNNT